MFSESLPRSAMWAPVSQTFCSGILGSAQLMKMPQVLENRLNWREACEKANFCPIVFAARYYRSSVQLFLWPLLVK